MQLDLSLTPDDLGPLLDRFFEIAAVKVRGLHREWDPSRGSPVFTVEGRYTTRSWTEWTLGFFCGMPLLLFEARGDGEFYDLGRRSTFETLPNHLTHIGVHDHGFNILSSYGNLRRLRLEGKIEPPPGESEMIDLALRVSGAVQAARWTSLADGRGYVYSFNGPHSLFCDTIRTCRITALSHRLGHVLLGDGDERINLLHRTIDHLVTTLRYNVYYGRNRDVWDVAGRVAHESIFDVRTGTYRCPSTQQGYSPFSTWTRGLAWVICGCAEQIEFLSALPEEEFPESTPRGEILENLRHAAEVTSTFYLAHSAADGIPLWDTGAPGAARLGDYTAAPSDPVNDHEPFDSSAAAIAGQGFFRLARIWRLEGRDQAAAAAQAAALGILRTLLTPPYLSEDPEHQGLILHSVYHRPRGWDHLPGGRSAPFGESSMWGDYHALELALLVERARRGDPFRAAVE